MQTYDDIFMLNVNGEGNVSSLKGAQSLVTALHLR